MFRVTEQQIYALLSGLEENKASTDIPIKLIKLASTALCQPLTTMYNELISTDMVPVRLLPVSTVTGYFLYR